MVAFSFCACYTTCNENIACSEALYSGFLHIQCPNGLMNIGCILMAAGTASRFGSNKLLYSIDGRPLIAHTLSALPVRLFARAVAVVSCEDTKAIANAAGYATVWNPQPERGQGGSIALGMRHMMDMDAIMFCVADQPRLRQESVQAMLAGYVQGSFCALAWRGKRGNPVIFPAFTFEALASLKANETGRAILTKYPDQISLVDAASAAELLDIDTLEDLQKIERYAPHTAP